MLDVFGGVPRLAALSGRHWLLRLRELVSNALVPVRSSSIAFPPAPVVPEHLRDDVQLEGDGFGALQGRQYVARFATTRTAPALLASIAHHLTSLVPDDLAAFEKTRGAATTLSPGDEFSIHIAGPWDGVVRVIETTPTAFTFATLRGHPEAGRIRFAVAAVEPGVLAVGITSWARCRDAAVELGYQRVGLGKRLQTSTWTTFLRRVGTLAGARQIGRVDVCEQVLADHAADDVSNDVGEAARRMQDRTP